MGYGHHSVDDTALSYWNACPQLTAAFQLFAFFILLSTSPNPTHHLTYPPSHLPPPSNTLSPSSLAPYLTFLLLFFSPFSFLSLSPFLPFLSFPPFLPFLSRLLFSLSSAFSPFLPQKSILFRVLGEGKFTSRIISLMPVINCTSPRFKAEAQTRAWGTVPKRRKSRGVPTSSLHGLNPASF